MWIAVTQFFNMAIIPILVAQTAEIDAEWYQNVGMNILSNFILFAFTPNISAVISPFVELLINQSLGGLIAIDQEDYNKLMSGPDLYG